MNTDEIIIKTERVPIDINYRGTRYIGEAIPVPASCRDGICHDLEIVLNGNSMGMIHLTLNGWRIEYMENRTFADLIGEEIMLWYK
ncbi:MAG: hypothetical protein V4608_06730 [Bacteroidota bacterium]